MAGKFPCPHAGCTLLERHPGLCVFANLSDKRGRRDSTQENTTASIVHAGGRQPVSFDMSSIQSSLICICPSSLNVMAELAFTSTAMSSVVARNLCPDAVFVRSNLFAKIQRQTLVEVSG